MKRGRTKATVSPDGTVKAELGKGVTERPVPGVKEDRPARKIRVRASVKAVPNYWGGDPEFPERAAAAKKGADTFEMSERGARLLIEAMGEYYVMESDKGKRS